MVIYADERPLLEILIERYGGGDLHVEEVYESGAITCRVMFCIVRDEGEGPRNLGFCFAGHHKSSYPAARHEAVVNAIKYLEAEFHESVKTCHYERVRTARSRLKKQMKLAMRETTRRRGAKAARHAAEVARVAAEAAKESAEAARQEAEHARQVEETARQQAVHAKQSAEVLLDRERATIAKLLEDLEKENDERIATDSCLEDTEAKLAELTKKYDALLLEKNTEHNANAVLRNNTNQLVCAYRELDARVHALAAENAALKQPTEADKA